MTKPEEDELAADKSAEDVELAKETLEDLDVEEEARDVKGGSVNIPKDG